MRSKRKKHRADSQEQKHNNGRAFFNNPFKGSLGGFKALEEEEKSISAPHSLDTQEEQSDDHLFRLAMKDVVPLKHGKEDGFELDSKKECVSDPKPVSISKHGEDFSNLVKESVAWDISFSDEYMEGAVSGVGPKTMKRLKRGEFSLQDFIDLHGLTKKEAESVVYEFIIQSHQKGLRCVLIVHGRGLGSIDNQPALKQELPTWLKRGALKRIVLAFVTAQPWDGGAGASYVLLKKG